MFYDDNIYYNPEKFGLEIVGSIDWSDGRYQFDMTVVWRDEAGQLYYGDDSGCSCPSPFEDFDGLAYLTAASFHEIAEHLKKRLGDPDADRFNTNQGQVVDLLSHLRTAAMT